MTRPPIFSVEVLEQRILLSASPLEMETMTEMRSSSTLDLVHLQRLETDQATNDILFERVEAITPELTANHAVADSTNTDEGVADADGLQELSDVTGASFTISGSESGTGYTPLTFTDAVQLSGVLSITLDNFIPSVGDTFTLITTTDTLTGSFSSASGLFGFGTGLYFEISQDSDSVDLAVKELSTAGVLDFAADVANQNDRLGEFLNLAYFGAPGGPLNFGGVIDAGPLSMAGAFTADIDGGDLVLTGSNILFSFQVSGTGITVNDLSFGLRLESDGAGGYDTFAFAGSGTAALTGVTGLNLSGTLSAEINETGVQSVDLGGASPHDFGTDEALTRVSGSGLTFAVSGVTSLTGNFSFEKVDLGDSEELRFSGSDISASLGAGVSGPFISISGATIKALIQEDGGYAFVSDSATASSSGLTGVTLTGTIGAEINTTGSQILTFGTNDTYDFGDTSERYQFTGNDLSIQFGDSFGVAGSVVFSSVSQTITLSGGDTAIIEGIAVGGTGIEGQFGIGVGSSSFVGFELVDLEFGYVLLRESAAAREWTTVVASAAAVSLSGVEDVQVTGSHIDLVINTAAVDGTVVDYTTTTLSVPLGDGSTVGVTLPVDDAPMSLTRLSGVLDIDLYGFLQTSGNFEIGKQDSEIVLEGGETFTASILTFGASGVKAFAGLNGGTQDELGLKLSDVMVGLALVSVKDDGLGEGDTRRWATLQASAGAVDEFVGLGNNVTMSATGVQVNINQAGGANADQTVIDYVGDDATDLVIPVGTGADVVFNLDGATGEHVEVFADDATFQLGSFLKINSKLIFEQRSQDSIDLGTGLSAQHVADDATLQSGLEALDAAVSSDYSRIESLSVKSTQLSFLDASVLIGGETADDALLSLDSIDVAFVLYTSTKLADPNRIIPNLYAAKITSDAIALDFAGLDLTVGNFEVQVNGASDWVALPGSNPFVDFSTSFDGGALELSLDGKAISIDYNQSFTGIVLDDAILNIGNFITISGDFGLQSLDALNIEVKTGLTEAEVNGNSTLKSGLDKITGVSSDYSTISSLEVSVTTLSATDANIFVGDGPYFIDSNEDGVINELDEPDLTAVGFKLESIEFALALFQSTTASDPDQVVPGMRALSTSFDNLINQDWGFLKVAADRLEILYNSGSEWGTNLGNPVADLATSFPENGGFSISAGDTEFVLGFNQELLSVSLYEGILEIGDFVQLTGDISYNRYAEQSVRLTNGETEEVTVTSFVAESVNVFVGAGPYFIDSDQDGDYDADDIPSEDATGLFCRI